MDAYLEALDLVKQHPGTSGQGALAKCILSLYNAGHSFSIGEILAPLDSRYSRVVMNMIQVYMEHGETEGLRQVGSWVYEHFPRLIEVSEAMAEARDNTHRKWDREREEEFKRLYPDE